MEVENSSTQHLKMPSISAVSSAATTPDGGGSSTLLPRPSRVATIIEEPPLDEQDLSGLDNDENENTNLSTGATVNRPPTRNINNNTLQLNASVRSAFSLNNNSNSSIDMTSEEDLCMVMMRAHDTASREFLYVLDVSHIVNFTSLRYYFVHTGLTAGTLCLLGARLEVPSVESSRLQSAVLYFRNLTVDLKFLATSQAEYVTTMVERWIAIANHPFYSSDTTFVMRISQSISHYSSNESDLNQSNNNNNNRLYLESMTVSIGSGESGATTHVQRFKTQSGVVPQQLALLCELRVGTLQPCSIQFEHAAFGTLTHRLRSAGGVGGGVTPTAGDDYSSVAGGGGGGGDTRSFGLSFLLSELIGSYPSSEKRLELSFFDATGQERGTAQVWWEPVTHRQLELDIKGKNLYRKRFVRCDPFVCIRSERGHGSLLHRSEGVRDCADVRWLPVCFALPTCWSPHDEITDVSEYFSCTVESGHGSLFSSAVIGAEIEPELPKPPACTPYDNACPLQEVRRDDVLFFELWDAWWIDSCGYSEASTRRIRREMQEEEDQKLNSRVGSSTPSWNQHNKRALAVERAKRNVPSMVMQGSTSSNTENKMAPRQIGYCEVPLKDLLTSDDQRQLAQDEFARMVLSHRTSQGFNTALLPKTYEAGLDIFDGDGVSLWQSMSALSKTLRETARSDGKEKKDTFNGFVFSPVSGFANSDDDLDNTEGPANESEQQQQQQQPLPHPRHRRQHKFPISRLTGFDDLSIPRMHKCDVTPSFPEHDPRIVKHHTNMQATVTTALASRRNNALSSCVEMGSIAVHPRHTFLDFIHSGWKIKTIVAIDCTEASLRDHTRAVLMDGTNVFAAITMSLLSSIVPFSAKSGLTVLGFGPSMQASATTQSTTGGRRPTTTDDDGVNIGDSGTNFGFTTATCEYQAFVLHRPDNANPVVDSADTILNCYYDYRSLLMSQGGGTNVLSLADYPAFLVPVLHAVESEMKLSSARNISNNNIFGVTTICVSDNLADVPQAIEVLTRFQRANFPVFFILIFLECSAPSSFGALANVVTLDFELSSPDDVAQSFSFLQGALNMLPRKFADFCRMGALHPSSDNNNNNNQKKHPQRRPEDPPELPESIYDLTFGKNNNNKSSLNSNGNNKKRVIEFSRGATTATNVNQTSSSASETTGSRAPRRPQIHSPPMISPDGVTPISPRQKELAAVANQETKKKKQAAQRHKVKAAVKSGRAILRSDEERRIVTDFKDTSDMFFRLFGRNDDGSDVLGLDDGNNSYVAVDQENDADDRESHHTSNILANIRAHSRTNSVTSGGGDAGGASPHTDIASHASSFTHAKFVKTTAQTGEEIYANTHIDSVPTTRTGCLANATATVVDLYMDTEQLRRREIQDRKTRTLLEGTRIPGGGGSPRGGRKLDNTAIEDHFRRLRIRELREQETGKSGEQGGGRRQSIGVAVVDTGDAVVPASSAVDATTTANAAKSNDGSEFDLAIESVPEVVVDGEKPPPRVKTVPDVISDIFRPIPPAHTSALMRQLSRMNSRASSSARTRSGSSAGRTSTFVDDFDDDASTDSDSTTRSASLPPSLRKRQLQQQQQQQRQHPVKGTRAASSALRRASFALAAEEAPDVGASSLSSSMQFKAPQPPVPSSSSQRSSNNTAQKRPLSARLYSQTGPTVAQLAEKIEQQKQNPTTWIEGTQMPNSARVPNNRKFALYDGKHAGHFGPMRRDLNTHRIVSYKVRFEEMIAPLAPEKRAILDDIARRGSAYTAGPPIDFGAIRDMEAEAARLREEYLESLRADAAMEENNTLNNDSDDDDDKKGKNERKVNLKKKNRSASPSTTATSKIPAINKPRTPPTTTTTTAMTATAPSVRRRSTVMNTTVASSRKNIGLRK